MSQNLTESHCLWGLILWLVWPRPALLKLLEKEWVSEGPTVDDNPQYVHKHHHQEANQEEREEGAEMSPGHTHPINQTAPVPCMGGVS